MARPKASRQSPSPAPPADPFHGLKTEAERNIVRFFLSLSDSAKVRCFRELYRGLPSFRKMFDRVSTMSKEELAALLDESLDEDRKE